MHVLFTAGRELSYPRNDVLLRAFQRLGAVDIVGETGISSLTMRNLRLLARLLPKLRDRRYDLIFVGFYGHMLMLPVSLLSPTPVLFDAFLSTYDTLCFDRKQFRPSSPLGRLAFWLDRTTCQRARSVLLDTPQHIDYFVDTFGLSPTRFYSLPVGCNQDLFYPQTDNPDGTTKVLYYTTYLPIHGVDTVIQAAAKLRAQPAIQFRLIGTGPEYGRAHRMAQEFGLDNVTFLPFIPLAQLPGEIAASGICLGGHFSRSDKADRVVPGKIYQILAMARPLIAVDTPANRALLIHGQSAYLIPPADPDFLADAILRLHEDTLLRESLSAGGRALFETCCSEAVITDRLKKILDTLL